MFLRLEELQSLAVTATRSTTAQKPVTVPAEVSSTSVCGGFSQPAGTQCPGPGLSENMETRRRYAAGGEHVAESARPQASRGGIMYLRVDEHSRPTVSSACNPDGEPVSAGFGKLMQPPQCQI
jgi:hypothetical protein